MDQYEELKNCKPFAYELQSLNSIIENNYCQIISIDYQKKFLIVAAYMEIQVIQFKNGELKKLARILKHKNLLSTLNFFNYNQNFASGAESIIIWPLPLISTKKYIQKISGHTEGILCSVIHPSKFLIVSGSYDKTIRFWYNFEQNFDNFTINNHKGFVFGLALNKEGNRLVSCGKDKVILVIEQNCNNFSSWYVRQTIKLNQFGFRICFINDNQFAFLPISFDKGNQTCSNSLYIYSPDQLQLYSKTKEIFVAGEDQSCNIFFPSIYIPDKQILVVKNGLMVNLLRLDEQFKNQSQYILFNARESYSNYIIGTISQDGEYLITWDNQSKQIQIRKYLEIN